MRPATFNNRNAEFTDFTGTILSQSDDDQIAYMRVSGIHRSYWYQTDIQYHGSSTVVPCTKINESVPVLRDKDRREYSIELMASGRDIESHPRVLFHNCANSSKNSSQAAAAEFVSLAWIIHLLILEGVSQKRYSRTTNRQKLF